MRNLLSVNFVLAFPVVMMAPSPPVLRIHIYCFFHDLFQSSCFKEGSPKYPPHQKKKNISYPTDNSQVRKLIIIPRRVSHALYTPQNSLSLLNFSLLETLLCIRHRPLLEILFWKYKYLEKVKHETLNIVFNLAGLKIYYCDKNSNTWGLPW